MKTNTAIVLLFTLLISTVSVKAQTIRAGINAANISIANDGSVDDNKIYASFQVGITGDIKLAPMLYLQPGILFTGKGAKSQAGNTTDATYYRATTNPFYVEVPLNLVFKTPNKVGPRLFVGAGPYLAVGVGGKNKAEGKFLGVAFNSEKSIEWSNDDPGTTNYEEGAGYGIMKRFDYGLNLTAGIEAKNIVLGLGYGHGFAKLQSGDGSGTDDKNKHRVVSLTLGFKLD